MNWVFAAWKIYGGFAAVLRSGYFWSAVLIWAILWPIWIVEGWWEISITVIPGLLGFSLAAMAMVLAFGNTQLKSVLNGRRGGGDESPFMQMAATFSIFLLIQIIAIILAVGAKAYYFPAPSWLPIFYHENIEVFTAVGWGVGFFFFVYALMQLIGAVAWVFRLFQVFTRIK